MKKISVIVASVLLAGCASTSNTPVTVAPALAVEPVKVSLAQVQRQQQAYNRSQLLWGLKVPKMLNQLKARVGKTWYVFSGSTPAGWDCSGLNRWAYQQLGYDIRHSATAQGHLGHYTKNPLPGDIVVWGWGEFYLHAGIYWGNGIAIHSGLHKGETTGFIRVDSPVFKGMKLRFVRVLPDPVK